MTESEMTRVERCGQLCEMNLRAASVRQSIGDDEGAAEARDFAGYWSEQAFEIAIPTGDHWA
ncbi:hypothetical protein [Luteimonas fraxinea]|uniref:Uncharacterized protein n=1 Tax=Luteimonas fraxinea TaxID=2901869 RepID=A0ABS8UBD7_9GAMM|nr:hypothetical protein [Luteimonas fraxinea]MCD9096534.1 hypothetical protein [Luteimonas fraxinea]